MAFESVRSYVQLASGLGEMTKARAMDAAQGLLALPGADEVTRRAVQVSTLADQLLEAARANRASLVSLVQGEVETALKRAEVARVADLDAARRALALLGNEVAELRNALATSGAAAMSSAARGPGRAVPGSAAVSTAIRSDGRTALADPLRPVAGTPTDATAPAPAAKKTATKRTPTKRTAKKTAAAGTTATPKKAARAAAKSAGPAKKAAPAAAKSAASAKKTTAKKTTAKKTTTQKATQ
jgi:hypothetical protein